ncbi:MAG: phosphoenolpyruvate synthase [Candidatus Pacebacteria bacterium]|nr:phosphoenolpyruvate synthase [Candidatus Paceibacterota bacterium]
MPHGFVLTADAYWYFLKFKKIDLKLKQIFSKFNPKSLQSLALTGKACRDLILKANFPDDLQREILASYRKLSNEYGENFTDVAVRSSATAEDLKGASFAGAMETFLNVKGEKQLLEAIKKCTASLFTDRAIAYREEKGFEHLKIALSAGVLKMVRSDLASSGIMFSLDTETGFNNVVLINSIYGIGELIVKGRITPDEFFVFKPTLNKDGFRPVIIKNLGRKNRKYIYKTGGGLKEVPVLKNQQLKFSLADDEVLTLARWGMIIEEHYKCPQDIEWAKDGKTGELFIVQSRPETVQALKDVLNYRQYDLDTNQLPIVRGIAIGNKIGIGQVKVIKDVANLTQFKKGEVLVTKMTDPDWVPIMRIAAAIVTDEGGKTAHAAIVSRELGIPCIVGTGNASQVLKTGQTVTVDCTQGLKGKVFSGKIPFTVKDYNLKDIPTLPTKIMVNIGAPDIAFQSSFLPVSGVGLAREEFIIAEKIKVHPLALYHFPKLKDQKLKAKIAQITIEHKDKKEFFIKELAEGIAQIAAAFWPKPVIVRLSDFKTNEYRALIGGELFEPEEENPMIGWRGASRYYDDRFKPAFLMECEAIKRVRDVFGLHNLKVMVPFCRTQEEGQKVLKVMKEAGLERGKDGLEVYVMCEIPTNVILAEQFLEIFDGMSIGSNDLSQLTLGIDRDNGGLSYIGDERNEAVKRMIKKVIGACRERGKYCGICGQAPSDFPDFAEFLVAEGIESMSLNPDTVIKTIIQLSSKVKNHSVNLGR